MARDLAGTLKELHARIPLGMRLGLDAMRTACAESGDPENAFPAVHVAGTNGKGSTCAMIESIARAAGLRTGLYTSPHLVRFAERIRIDGEPIADHELVTVLDEALVHDLSFFEAATLAAFLAFRAQKVDLAIVEVGLGGRLDATNILPSPRCSAITRIALDHQDRLGSTIEEIAREKAGIVRPGVPVVIAEDNLAARAATRDAEVVLARTSLVLPAVALEGAHQRENARVAWTVAEVLGLDEGARAKGLASVRWPGRLERIGRFVLDGAHNPDGIRALVAALAQEKPGAIVFGALADKNWEEMTATVDTLGAPRVNVALASERGSAPLPDLAPSIEAALARAEVLAGERGIVVCGSLHLIGRVRAHLLGQKADPPVAL